MNRQPDIDRLLRSWLDEGAEAPPERYVWAALERIETTRQRGALRVSLEEHVMRAQPILAVAAVLAVAAIGLAVYLSLGGGANIGDPDATPTPARDAVETEDFSEPFAVVLPEDWVLVETRHSAVLTPGDPSIEERIVVFQTADAEIFAGLGEPRLLPWPDDLAVWLEDYPAPTEATGPGSLEVTPTGESEVTVDGTTATVIEATTTFTSEPGFEATVGLVSPETANLGTDVLIFDGEGQIRFVMLDERGLVITYHATEGFSESTFQAVLDTLDFTEE